MSRARVAALAAVLLVAGVAGSSTASADQPPEQHVADSPVPAQKVRTDRPSPAPQLVDREPRRRGSMPHVLPRGPRAVPMPELFRSGPRPVPMPRLGPDIPLDHPRRGEPRDLRGPRDTEPDGPQVIPEELEDVVETLVP